MQYTIKVCASGKLLKTIVADTLNSKENNRLYIYIYVYIYIYIYIYIKIKI